MEWQTADPYQTANLWNTKLQTLIRLLTYGMAQSDNLWNGKQQTLIRLLTYGMANCRPLSDCLPMEWQTADPYHTANIWNYRLQTLIRLLTYGMANC